MSTGIYFDRNLEYNRSENISNIYEVYNAPNWSAYYSESNPCSLDSGYTKGQNTPRFHARVKAGELIPMTHFEQFTVKGKSAGSLLIMYNQTPWGHRVQYPRYTDVTDWVMSYADVVAHASKLGDINLVGDAAAKIYGNTHDTLTFLVELADVRSLFINLLETLLKGKFPRGWKGMSGQWLSSRYGWRTLIFDIEDLNRALRNLKGERQRYSEYAVHKQNWVDSSYYANGVGGNRTRHVIMTVDGTVANKGSVVADINLPKFAFNPLMTAWEKVPFSFVLDWVFTVGKAIAAWSFLSYQPEWVASTGYEIRLRRKMNVFCDGWASHVIASQSHNYQTAEIEGKIHVRTPSYSIPKFPRFTLNLNPYKVIDLMTLVIQRV